MHKVWGLLISITIKPYPDRLSSMTYHLLFIIAAYQGKLGRVFPAASILQVGGASIFLFNNTILEDAVITKFSAYIVKEVPVTFQIWRPVNVEQGIYRLVGQKRVVPRSVHVQYDVSLLVPILLRD